MPVDSWRTVWHNWVLSRKNKRQMWGHLYHAATVTLSVITVF
jgi:hypothetical protein